MEAYRERLLATRNHLEAYRDSLSHIPECIEGVRGRIAGLRIYPIKSLAAVPIATARVGSHGLEDNETGMRDRMAMLSLRQETTDFDAVRFCQRLEPMLSQIRMTIGSLSVNLECGGHKLFAIPRALFEPREGEPLRIKMNDKGDICEGVPVKGSVIDWLRSTIASLAPDANYRSQDIDLVVPPGNFQRPAIGSHSGDTAETLYSDGGQVLITSTSTLDWVNQRLEQQYGPHYPRISMNAFRPNIILNGPTTDSEHLPAHIEDLIQELTIGDEKDIELDFDSLCVRCSVAQVMGGRRRSKEPLRILKQRPARLTDGQQVTFGVNGHFPSSMWGRTFCEGASFEIQKAKI